MINQNSDRAVNLLQEHDAGQPVRPRHAAEGQPVTGRGLEIGSKPVGAADEEGERRRAGVAPAPEEGGKLIAGDVLAAAVERDRQGIVGHSGTQPHGLVGHAELGRRGPWFGDFRNRDAGYAGAASEGPGTFEVSVRQLALRSGLEPADGAHLDAHRLGEGG